MTEQEKRNQARQYILDLANGLNPFTGESLPSQEIVNDVRISRCLFYAADILAEKHIVPIDKTVTKIPFALTNEQLSRFPYSDSSISLSEIARRLNALSDNENMKKIRYKQLANWLLEIDVLYTTTDEEGTTVKWPTSTGKELGISVAKRITPYGMRQYVVYNRAAQQFILDNLEAVIS